MYGKIAKSILNVYFDIGEYMIVDNKLSKQVTRIKSVSDIQIEDLKDSYILFACDNSNDSYEEIKGAIYKFNEQAKIVEILPDFRKSIIDKINHDREIQTKLLTKLKKALFEEKQLCYSPIKTNSRFFLPYVYTDEIQKTIVMTDDYYESDDLRLAFFQFEDGMLSSLLQLGSRGDVIVDIGSNIGNHVLFYANELDAQKIEAFEPVEEICYILNKNVELNNLKERVNIHCVGLSGQPGFGHLDRFGYDCTGGARIAPGSGDIQLKRMDDFKISNVFFIKIDVEGMEKSVLLGCRETIEQSVPFIMIEILDKNFDDVEAFLGSFGYEYRILSSNTGYKNCLFYRKL